MSLILLVSSIHLVVVHCANFSIFAMGIMPYITASIIVQLLQMDVVPKFAEWAKQGEVGRRKLAQFTRYFTIVLAFIQSFAMSFGFNQYLWWIIDYRY